MRTPARIEPRLLGQMTKRRVVDVLRARGPSSRAEIVRQTGISAPTISKAVGSLLEAGLLEESDIPSSSAVGRPGRPLMLATKTSHVIGVVLDADRIRTVAAGLDGGLRADTVAERATPSSYAQLLDAVVGMLTPVLDSGINVQGIGISTPGLTDQLRQEVVLSPNLPCTNGRSPSADLQARLGVPCWVIRETHALCLAERLQGGARALDDFVMLDAGAGLGLGVVQRGELMHGHRGLAGEIGHMTVEPDGLRCGCGNRGCLETRATDTALLRDASRTLGRSLDLDELSDILATPSAERAAIAEDIDRVTTWLAVAVAGAINLFNPRAVFVHARWPKARPELFDEVRRRAAERALHPTATRCPIEFATATKLHGAVAGGLQRLFDQETH
jgi:predicted NBD/HSP70 family sugar kinase